MNTMRLPDAKKMILSAADSYAKHFADLSGIEAFVIPYYDGPDMEECTKGCAFCRWAEEMAHPGIDCRLVVTEAGKHAIETGNQYAFFCRSGFIHLAAPIRLKNQHIATMVAGPMQLCVSGEQALDAVMRQMHIPPQHSAEAMKRIVDVPNLTPARAGKALALLSSLACHVTNLGEQLIGSPNLLEKHHLQSLEHETYLVEIIRKEKKAETANELNLLLRLLEPYLQGEDKAHGKNLALMYLLFLARIYADLHPSSFTEIQHDFGLQYLPSIQNAQNEQQIRDCLMVYNADFMEKIFAGGHMVHDGIIAKVLDIISHNYMNKITLKSTAEQTFLSSSYLSKIFKEEVGYNFNTYLNKFRIEKAKKLLVNDNINIVQVSNLVGYEDQSYFSKVFRRMTGTTPKKFKDSKAAH